jgi:hypothetical protein
MLDDRLTYSQSHSLEANCFRYVIQFAVTSRLRYTRRSVHCILSPAGERQRMLGAWGRSSPVSASGASRCSRSCYLTRDRSSINSKCRAGRQFFCTCVMTGILSLNCAQPVQLSWPNCCDGMGRCPELIGRECCRLRQNWGQLVRDMLAARPRSATGSLLIFY